MALSNALARHLFAIVFVAVATAPAYGNGLRLESGATLGVTSVYLWHGFDVTLANDPVAFAGGAVRLRAGILTATTTLRTVNAIVSRREPWETAQADSVEIGAGISVRPLGDLVEIGAGVTGTLAYGAIVTTSDAYGTLEGYLGVFHMHDYLAQDGGSFASELLNGQVLPAIGALVPSDVTIGVSGAIPVGGFAIEPGAELLVVLNRAQNPHQIVPAFSVRVRHGDPIVRPHDGR